MKLSASVISDLKVDELNVEFQFVIGNFHTRQYHCMVCYMSKYI